jgi:hypothetical protein
VASPGEESTGPRRCPQCRQTTLVFSPSVAVIVRPTPARRAGDTGEDRKLRLQYKPAWVCRDDKCRYVRLAGEKSEKRKAKA